MSARVRQGSSNVFRDLGFRGEEAAHLRIRSDLMIAVSKVIEERSLTQVEAADLLGVTQPRISDVVRGKIDLFSIDMLVRMLSHAGVHVTVSATNRAPTRTRTR